MSRLGFKKFFVDYILATVLIIVALSWFSGQFTVMDTKGVVVLPESCSSLVPEAEILQKLEGTLEEGESCEIVSPCADRQAVQCEGTLSASGLFDLFLAGDSLSFRMAMALKDNHGLVSWADRSTFRYEPNWVLFLLGYVIVLIESVAILFALWRQNALRSTFALADGARTDQLLNPVVFATLLAISIVAINLMVFNHFGYEPVKNLGIFDTMLNSVYGIAFVIVIAPLAEELTFRGVFLKFFIDRQRLWLGTITVSLVFSIFHGLVEESVGWQLYKSSIYFFLSVALCWLYIKQKNLWSPIIFHSAYNGTMVILYKLMV